MPATRTFIDVPAERGGSAAQDGGEHFQMQPGEPFPAALKERFSCGADHIGHLHGRPRHLLVVGRFRVGCVDRQRIERTDRGRDVAPGEMEVDHRLPQVGVAEEQLNGAQVGAALEQMCGEAVP